MSLNNKSKKDDKKDDKNDLNLKVPSPQGGKKANKSNSYPIDNDKKKLSTVSASSDASNVSEKAQQTALAAQEQVTTVLNQAGAWFTSNIQLTWKKSPLTKE